MRHLRRLRVLPLAFVPVFGLSVLPAQWAVSQNRSGTPADLMEILRNLPPDQQEEILRQIGGASGTSTGGTTRQEAARREGAQQLEPRPPVEGEEAEPKIPVLKGEDWVIVEVDYHLPPRPIWEVAQANNLPAAQAPVAAAPSATPPTVGAGVGLGQPRPEKVPERELTEKEKKTFDDLIATIRSKNPYHLSSEGVLTLPGFPGIALLGLTQDEASLRLQTEPALHELEIRLTRLPLRKTGLEALKPFGYDLFDHAPSTFAPVTNVPLPGEYVVGSGDELEVQLYGNQNRVLRLVVGRDGKVNFPELGPIYVAGQLFTHVKAEIESRVARQMIGVRASVAMGETRSIRVFVLGEARRPGSYTISGLGTITSALYAAGGVRRIGSLRNIQLKRGGTLVRQLDLYDLLIRGDTTDDAKLLPGDVIFIPAVGATVGIYGEVQRPAIYEIKGALTVTDLLQLAGGLTPEADRSNAMLTRIDESQHRVVIPIDLSAGATSGALRNGDLVRVARLRPTLDSGIVVQGHLYTPGTFAYRPGIRLTDVIHSVDELRPNADLHYVLIRRELAPDRRISVLSADLTAALNAPRSAADVELMPRDRITAFDLASGRDHVIQPLLDELRVQGTAAHPTETVKVEGQVKVPGEYPLEPGMKVSDLIRAGGGPADPAYVGQAEVTRYTVGASGSRSTELVTVDLAAAMRDDPSANIPLQAFDTLSVKQVPLWGEGESLTLKGEVRFPGVYPVRRGETLKSVIDRAGGLTQFAYADGSVFTRESLRKREQEQLDMLAARMERDITSFALGGAVAAGQTGGAATLSLTQSLLSQLRGSKAIGRMVIDLPRLMREPVGSQDDVYVRDGDQLIVPRFQQQVTVLGEVQNTTSLLYNPRLSRDDYIAQSGGLTRRADQRQIYVVRANGSVLANDGSRWFQTSSRAGIKPGDTIVVPLNVEHLPPLPFWQAVTGILYNVAIAAAAVHAL